MKYAKKHFIMFPVIGVVIIIPLLLISQNNKYEFTIEKWNSYSYNERQLLAENFIKKYQNKNLTKNDIINMLGLDTDYYNGYSNRYKTDNNLVYDFGGRMSAFVSGNIAMIIEFDENDIAISYNIIKYSW